MNTKFSEAIVTRKDMGYIPVIPDLKKYSPGEGELFRDREPIEVVRMLAEAGAPAFSVVTEPENFGGSLQLLRKVAAETDLPVLRKDFIRDSDDLRITKECGAEAVLLICAAHTLTDLSRLYEEALKLELEPLVEAHTREDLEWAGKMEAMLVGINNRNILELERDDGDISTTELLAEYAPPEAVLISESSIRTPEEVDAAIKAGADAVLVGTALWQAEDMIKCYREFSDRRGNRA